MRIDAWQLVWLCTAISSLMEHFMPIRLPLWHFPPTVTLARFWHLIGWSAMKQPITIQDYKSGPRVMRGMRDNYGHGELKESVGVTQGTFVTPSSSAREQQIFITVPFYLCCKLWEDNNGVNVVKILIRSPPIISIVRGPYWGLCLTVWCWQRDEEERGAGICHLRLPRKCDSAMSGICIYVEMVHKVSCVTRDARDM